MVEKEKNNINFQSEIHKFLLNQKLTKLQLGLTDQEIEKIINKLPDKKYYEFAYHMLFKNIFVNLEEEWKKWTPLKEWHYPIIDLNRFNIIILQNLNKLHNQNVLDIGCSIGYLSLFSLHVGAKNVIGVDIRENKLKIANFICQNAQFTNYQFIKSDINNTYSLLEHCQKVDTILFSGTLYHTSNHYEILKTFSKSKAKNIIIENSEVSRFVNDHTPNIDWKQEEVHNNMNGWHESNKNVLVGRPNQAWINAAMTELGWRLCKINYFKMYKLFDGTSTRCCSVFERKDI
jgi:2-polyprenyl-3-methyl-5-hydroxy-6-metoxy-1,4-benzoquinol methylase